MPAFSSALSQFIRAFCVFVLISLSGILQAPDAHAGGKSLRLPINVDKRKLAKDAFLITRSIDGKDLTIQSAKLKNFSSKPKVALTKKRSLLAITVGSFSKGNVYSGIVKLNPKAKSLAPISVKKRKKGQSKVKVNFAQASALRIERAGASSPNGQAVVAMFDSAFTASGPKTASWMALAGRDTVATAMAQAECYRDDDGFIIAETSKEFFKARAEEIALCKNGLADPSTCFNPQAYVVPNSIVRGSFVSDGALFSISLSFIDETGLEAASTLVQGDAGSFIDLLLAAGADLGQKICEARSLKVSLDLLFPHFRNCSYTDNGGTGSCGCSETAFGRYWEGGYYNGEMKGPVGTVFQLSSSSGQTANGTISCGAWTKTDCGESLCCTREAGQTTLSNYSAQLDFPLASGHCYCGPGNFQTNLEAKVTKASKSKSENLFVECLTG